MINTPFSQLPLISLSVICNSNVFILFFALLKWVVVQRVGEAFAFPRSSDMFYLSIFSVVSPKSDEVCDLIQC